MNVVHAARRSVTKPCIVVLICVLMHGAVSGAPQDLRLWYSRPATHWNEALPVGNGRLGGMVFSAPDTERIQLNESSVWAGSPYRNDNPAARAALPVVQRLIFEGRYTEARQLVDTTFITRVAHDMPYPTVGNLRVVPPVKPPLIADGSRITPRTVGSEYLYDVRTAAGRTYTLRAKEEN